MSEREPSILTGKQNADEAEVDDQHDEGTPEREAPTERVSAREPDPESPEKETGASEEAEAPDVATEARKNATEAPKEEAEPAPDTKAETDEPAKPIRRSAPLKGRSSPTFYVAGFWRRFAAAAIDVAVIVPVALILAWIAGAIAGVHLPASRHRGIDFWLDLLLASDPALLGILGLLLAIGITYALVFQITMSHTLGMRALKIRIIDVYGEAPSTGRSVARTAGYLACLATLNLGFLWIGFDAEKRGLHDWVSGTYVVKA